METGNPVKPITNYGDNTVVSVILLEAVNTVIIGGVHNVYPLLKSMYAHSPGHLCILYTD